MKRRRVFAEIFSLINFNILFCVFALVIGSAAQENSKSAEGENAGAELTATKQTAAPGETVLLKIKLKLADGEHANSNNPADPYLIPTVFIPKKNEAMEWVEIEYPEGTEVIASFSPEPLRVFEDGAEIRAQVKISDRAAEQSLKAEGSLRLQVCDERQCYPPRSIPLSIQIEVKRSESTQTSKNR